MRGIGANRINKMTDTSLPIEQVVYVPSTNKQQKAISQQETARRVAEVKRFLSGPPRSHNAITRINISVWV